VQRNLVPGGDVLDRWCRAVGDLDGSSPRYISEDQSYVVQAGTGHQRPDGCHWSRLHWITNFTVHVIDRMTPMPPGGKTAIDGESSGI
jgi:hypothetical protein